MKYIIKPIKWQKATNNYYTDTIFGTVFIKCTVDKKFYYWHCTTEEIFGGINYKCIINAKKAFERWYYKKIKEGLIPIA